MSTAKDTARQIFRPDEAGEQAGELESFLGYNLKRAYMVLIADFRRALGDDGFSPRVFSALSLIVQYPDITQSELARRLGIERSGLVAIVDELESRGYLRRNPVPGDRRVQALAPTPAGESAYRHAQHVVKVNEAALLSHLSAEEQDTLISLLRKIRQVED